MNTIKNKGFTIIELMIAVAIIGILAAIAVPAYSNYTTRARVSESLALADSAKTAVAEYYQSNGTLPTSNTQAGLTSTIQGSNTSAVNVTTGGQVVATTSIGGITNFSLSLSPAVSNGSITWTCYVASASGQYAPSSCSKI